MRLDVSVADALRVNVGERAEQLVDVKLDLENWHGGLHLIEKARCPVDGLGDVLLDEIEVDFVFLRQRQSLHLHCVGIWTCVTYAFAIGIVEGLELDNVWVSHYAHDLQFSVLHGLVNNDVHTDSTWCGISRTLKRLSCNTLLMAASSPLGDSFVWKTTPKEPLPTILHWVYCISFVSPVSPSWTFSRITSANLN